jgi:type VI secretion system Hcp family effector
MNRIRYVLLLALLLSAGAEAQAQETSIALASDMFIKLDDIPGEATFQGYERWTEIQSYSHALTAAFDFGGGGGGAGVTRHEPIVFTKRLDKTTPQLFDRMNKGQALVEVQIDFLSAGEQPFAYLSVRLEDVHITSYSVSASSGDDRPTEEVSLVYRRIELSYTETNADGSPGETQTVGWDVSTNTPLSIARESIEVQVDGSEVVFIWQTTGEDGVYGYEVQHLEQDGFRRAAYVPASGWSSQALEYEVRIRGLDDGVHVFRLAGLTVDGRISYSDEILVTLGEPSGYALALDAPYPNPVRERATIGVSIDRYENARISVFDLLGREVAVLHDGMLQPGIESRFEFEPSESLPAGVYVVRATAGELARSTLLTVVR